jgi:hypothetical protein
MEYALDTQARGYYGQQALAQAAEEQRLEREIFEPARKIQEILETGTRVSVNHALSFTRDINKLSEFLVINNTTVRTYSYFSTPNSMRYNSQLTTSEELNDIIIKKLFARSEMKCLSSCIGKEVNKSIHKRLRVIYEMVGEEYQKLDLSSQTTDDNIKTFVCRHLSFAYIFGIIQVENINIIEYFSTSRSDDTGLATMYDKLEKMTDFISYNIGIIVSENFNKNITFSNLIDWHKELNLMGMHAFDDAIEPVLKFVKTQQLHQKISKSTLKCITEKLATETSIEKQQQMQQENHYLNCISRKAYPIVNNCFESTEDNLGFSCSSFSIATFVQFIHEDCQYIYYNEPFNYEEKYLIYTVNHAMGLKIKHEQDGIVIKFYDPNKGNEKIICITHGDYAKEITISDFFNKKQLELYKILLMDNYELPTILCIRAIDLHNQ